MSLVRNISGFIAVSVLACACNSSRDAKARDDAKQDSGVQTITSTDTRNTTAPSLFDAPSAGVGAPLGPFRRSEPSGGVLTLRREGADWRVSVTAGGAPNGAATAGDCEVQALGPRRGDRIEAKIVPFSGEQNEVSAEDLGGTDIPVTVTLSGPVAVVEAGEAAGSLCPVGSDLDGRYSKAD